MSAPFAAGVAALYKQRFGDTASATLKDWIIRQATPGVVQGGGAGGTADRLLFTGSVALSLTETRGRFEVPRRTIARHGNLTPKIGSHPEGG